MSRVANSSRREVIWLLAVVGWLLVCPHEVLAALPVSPQQSISDQSLHWPTWDQWRRLILLQDYNTRIVILGTTLLGCAAGMIGSFTLLRKRALMGDALSHATLPGIGLAFIVATQMGMDGKTLPVLLCGATLTGLIGVGTILGIRRLTKLSEDTALGAVLSVFFGAGMALLGVIQQMREGHAAGLESFIYGKTASMGVQDTLLISAAGAACIAVCVILFKELKLLCFDEAFASSRGLPTLQLDIALMGLVVVICIVGLQAVGLVLMIALLVIPAAAARFWTERMPRMFVISGLLGALGGMVGAGVSAVFSKLPSGAMIVLVCSAFFFVSMICGTRRGVLVRLLRRMQLNRSIDHQHLLRAVFEILEPERAALAGELTDSIVTRVTVSTQAASIKQLLSKRSWSVVRLRRAIRRAERCGAVSFVDGQVRLTANGVHEAARLTRQHRLWELYLINYADTALARVDRDADAIEHVLEPQIVARLESLLDNGQVHVPASPHQLDSRASSVETALPRGG